MNQKNQEFYETLLLEEFKKFASSAGILSNKDVELIGKYVDIHSAKNILDVGAGWGRVVQYLVDNKVKADIDAVERVAVLAERIPRNNNVRVYCQDIAAMQLTKSYDVILCLWTFVHEFEHKERQQVLQKLFDTLEPKGSLVLDIVLDSSRSNATKKDGDQLVVETKEGTITLYNVKVEEIQQWFPQAALQHISYEPIKGRKRELIIITK